jgi:hypothetical protein
MAYTRGDFAHKVETAYSNPDLDESKVEIRSAAGMICWIHVISEATEKRYLKVFDAVGDDVTIGTTEADYNFTIPTQGDSNGAGFVLPVPIVFQNGITIAATTGRALDDDSAPGANEVNINMAYKQAHS